MRRKQDNKFYERVGSNSGSFCFKRKVKNMDDKIKKIRELNDNLRQNFTGGRVLITQGVAELPIDKQLEVIEKVRNFSNFNQDNDPNGKHDFGAFDVNSITYFWKIDYYDVDYQYQSLDPSDESITNRVLTVMLAEEY